ncbi:MAG: hypothetical protein IBJ03_17860 [Gemmatimonadaceae bacterium]|nr:hypothetical protein [Gemmatimonadaceae bacterium]
MRRIAVLSSSVALGLLVPLLSHANAQGQQRPRSSQDTSRRVVRDTSRGPRPAADTLLRAYRDDIRGAVRDARTITRREMRGDSATLAARNATAATTAFSNAEAREVFDRARAAREQQDSALKAYRATTTQRMSLGMGARKLGLEKLMFRGDNVAEISWRRGVGVRVRPVGSRMTVPMASDVSGDFVSAVSIPYFPGREQLWFPSSDFGTVKTDVDDRDIIHPLARGAERWYRYDLGDSARITLPDGQIIRLQELKIAGRKPDWRTFVGSFWFDRERGQLVRAAYRLSMEIDIWSTAMEEIEKDEEEYKVLGPKQDSILRARLPREVYLRDSAQRVRQRITDEDDKPGTIVTSLIRPMKARLDGITVEYALYKGKFWLPRAHSATASADVMFMRIPFRFDEKFTYDEVDGDFTLAAIPPARNRWAPRDSGTIDSTAVDMSAGDVSITVSSGGSSRRPTQDSTSRDSVLARRYGNAMVRQCKTDSVWTRVETRYEGTMRIAYDLPCNMDKLKTSSALPPAVAADEQIFDLRSQDELLKALDLSLQAPWGPQLPTIRSGSDLFRYNRVEGLSAGVEVKQELGAGYTLRGVGRIGHADWHANGELLLSRSNGARTVTGGVYHRLLAANPEWAGALSIGPSLPALLYGRDEGFYYRAYGVELSERREQRRGSLETRLFVERQWTAGDSNVVNTFSLARALGDRRFAPNILAEPGSYAGAQLTWARSIVERPAGLRLINITRLEGATGTFEYARGSLETTLSRPIGGWAAALTGSIGSSLGHVPFQREWYVGGLRTVRGQLPGTQNGNSFWFGRAEIGRGRGAFRPVGFFDVGWAGNRKTWGQIQPQRGAGFGFGVLDGLLRVDIAKGLYPHKGWRTDFYLGAPL